MRETLTDEELCTLREIAENYRTGREVWKVFVKLGIAVSAISGFCASIALIWQTVHGR
ncbi:hypothetical protein [Acidocella facilis]|uniref:hypothetical protein n=1 Tax=Acidocella facilis TaxID=525 RepID=UPI0012DEB634|nr:hypothetical protein [Acidocella facilis]